MESQTRQFIALSIELLIFQLLKITFSQLDDSNQQFDAGTRVCNYYYSTLLLFIMQNLQQKKEKLFDGNLSRDKREKVQNFHFRVKEKLSFVFE